MCNGGSTGVLRLDESNVDFRSPYGGFGGFVIPSNGLFATVGGLDMYEDIDDVKIQTTGPIGCIGSESSAPVAPTNLRVK